MMFVMMLTFCKTGGASLIDKGSFFFRFKGCDFNVGKHREQVMFPCLAPSRGLCLISSGARADLKNGRWAALPALTNPRNNGESIYVVVALSILYFLCVEVLCATEIQLVSGAQSCYYICSITWPPAQSKNIKRASYFARGVPRDPPW